MKKLTLMLFAGLVLAALHSSAQTMTDIYNQNQATRDQQAKNPDSRGVGVSIFGTYFLAPSAQINNQSAFSVGLQGGLKISIPSFTSGDGTLGGDITGDWTICGTYNTWSGAIPADLNDPNLLPDWNSYSGLLGFRIGISDLISFEPQGGYTYGTYTGLQSADVSGPTFGLNGGITIIHGLEITATLQSVVTKAFGTTFDYGVGMSIRF
jgi:hypothetical protein